MVLIFAFLIPFSLISSDRATGINSTENRQQLLEVVDVRHTDFAILELEREFNAGSSGIAVGAWMLYQDLRKGKTSEYAKFPDARDRLIRDGICIVRDSVLQLREFPISDELPKLTRTERSRDLKR